MKQVCSLWSRTADILLQGCRLTQEASGLAWEPWKWQLLKKARNTNISPITGCMYASGKYFTTKKIWQARKQSQSTQKHNKKKNSAKEPNFSLWYFHIRCSGTALGSCSSGVPLQGHGKMSWVLCAQFTPLRWRCPGTVHWENLFFLISAARTNPLPHTAWQLNFMRRLYEISICVKKSNQCDPLNAAHHITTALISAGSHRTPTAVLQCSGSCEWALTYYTCIQGVTYNMLVHCSCPPLPLDPTE